MTDLVDDDLRKAVRKAKKPSETDRFQASVKCLVSQFPTDELKRLLNDHPHGDTFFAEIETLAVDVRTTLQGKALNLLDLKARNSQLENIFEETVVDGGPLEAFFASVERKQGISPTPAPTSKSGRRQSWKEFENVCLWLLSLKILDRPHKNRQGGSPEEEQVPETEEEKQRKLMLRNAFLQATEYDLAEQSAETLNQLQQRIKNAEIIQGCRLVGLNDDEDITIEAVNNFLRAHAGEDLAPEDKVRLSRLISHLRGMGFNLQIQVDGEWCDCTLSHYYRADRDSHLMVVRETGTGQRRFWRRAVLPESLRLTR